MKNSNPIIYYKHLWKIRIVRTMDWGSSGNLTSRPIWLTKNLIIMNSLRWNPGLRKSRTSQIRWEDDNREGLKQSLLGTPHRMKKILNANSSRSKCNRNNYLSHGIRPLKLRQGQWKVISIIIKVIKNIRWWSQRNRIWNKMALRRKIRWIQA